MALWTGRGKFEFDSRASSLSLACRIGKKITPLHNDRLSIDGGFAIGAVREFADIVINLACADAYGREISHALPYPSIRWYPRTGLRDPVLS